MKALAVQNDSSLIDLNKLEIASPCSASWDDMVGDERTRHCGDCSKNVFNIAEMTSAEVKGLIQETEGRVCVRLFRRKDGTVLTSDCPVGLAERTWRRARNGMLASAALALTLFSGALLFFFGRTTCNIDNAQGWVQSQREYPVAGGLKAPVEHTMGEPMAEPLMGDVAVPQPAPRPKMGKLKVVD